MPSDPRIRPALDALQRQIAAYRSVAVGARERVRELLAKGSGAERARLELGTFGGARIDATRFAELGRGAALDVLSIERLRKAATTLDDLLAESDDSFVVDVLSGGSLPDEVQRALARLGRAFGAAAVIEHVRAGRYLPERHESFLAHYPYARWNKLERSHAPPLVIAVDGADLFAASLAPFVDGAARFVLVVRGQSSPAPLVRLVTPATFVLVTDDVAALTRFTSYDGPAVAALTGNDAATFVHDPLGGRALWQRLTITRRPESEGRKTFGGLSPKQQREELAQLAALAEQPRLPDSPIEVIAGTSGGGGDVTERLAAWLLAESGLSGAS